MTASAEPAIPPLATAIAKPSSPRRSASGSLSGTKADQAEAKLHKVAKQFEATFMTEMLRMAEPEDDKKSAGAYSAGRSGGTFQPFMDQALGEAASANGGTGLARQIEDSLRRTHATLHGAR